MTFKRHIKKFTFLIFFFSSAYLLYAADSRKANVILYDQIVRPGEKTYIVAKLRKGIFSARPEISGERIEFLRRLGRTKIPLGIALTGEDGTAVKEISPLGIGIHSFIARPSETKRYTAEESEGIIACWDPKRPIIVVDMDGAVFETPKIELPFLKIDKDSKPIPDAPQVLRRLSKRYNIIFLTARGELLLNKTRLWLKEHKFPIAPVFTFRPGEDPTMIGEYKDEKIKEWKKEGWDLRIGIGNKAHDAEAYLENRMKAIIIEDEEELPEKAITVKGWKEIERVILKSQKSHKTTIL